MEWININKQLPEYHKDIIVAYKDSFNIMSVGIATYINGMWFSEDDEVIEHEHNIKYWMPIPPLPTE